jgi:hypothetical protein
VIAAIPKLQPTIFAGSPEFIALFTESNFIGHASSVPADLGVLSAPETSPDVEPLLQHVSVPERRPTASV